MSNWTHVAAIIRMDGIQDLVEFSQEDWDSIIGKEYQYGADSSVRQDFREHPENYLPGGSEGTLHKSIWVNPNKSHCDAYTISIFGDLRDHYDIDTIIDWFNTLCDKLVIRQACITVTNDIHGTKTVEYDKTRPTSRYSQIMEGDD